MKNRAVGSVIVALLATHVGQGAVAVETQSVYYDKDKQELTSSALIKLLNTKLDGKYQDLELIVGACFGGDAATRAVGATGLKGDWSVSTATDIDHGSNDLGKIDGAANFKVGNGEYNGWLAAWVSKLGADGNTIGNKALADYAEAEKRKVFNPKAVGDPQYTSSGAAADNMTVHGGAKSNHALLIQQAGFVDLLQGVETSLKKAGYKDDEITKLGQFVGTDDFTWANFDRALDDLRKKLDAHPQEEKLLIDLETHGSKEQRTVAYMPDRFGTPGGGAILTASDYQLPIHVDDPTVLAVLGQGLLRPSGGFFFDDPSLIRNGPAVLRFSTLEQSLVNPGAVGVFVNNINIGTLNFGQSGSGDYQITIPDTVLSGIFSDVAATGLLNVGFGFSSQSDWLRLATLEDWKSSNYTNLDYGIGIAAPMANATPSVPEVGGTLWMLSAVVSALLLVNKRDRGRRV